MLLVSSLFLNITNFFSLIYQWLPKGYSSQRVVHERVFKAVTSISSHEVLNWYERGCVYDTGFT